MKVGQVYITTGVNEKMEKSKNYADFVRNSFERFCENDWGDICNEDAEINDMIAETGNEQVIGVYKFDNHISSNLWIIADLLNEITTLFLADEY